MRVVFSSDHQGTANGFKAKYEIRKLEEAERRAALEQQQDAAGGADYHYKCRQELRATPDRTSDWLHSPVFGNKYKEDMICEWTVTVRPEHRVGGEQFQLILLFPSCRSSSNSPAWRWRARSPKTKSPARTP